MRVEGLEPEQWRRLYNLLVQPNRASTSLYILHEQGRIVSVTPAYAQAQLGLPDEIDDAQTAAEELYPTWGRGAVAIFEKEALRSTFDRIQRARDDGDDIFSFLIKLFNELASEQNIVVYPNPFEKWRAISPALPRAFARAVAPDGARVSVVVGVYDENGLYFSLLLGFEKHELTLVTTLPAQPAAGWREDYPRLLSLAETKFAPAALGVFLPLSLVEQHGIGAEAIPRWLEAERRGEIVCSPGSLAQIIARVATDLV